MKTLYRKYIPKKNSPNENKFWVLEIYFSKREWALPLSVCIYKGVIRVMFLAIELSLEEYVGEIEQ
jgi:hypothetical protein